MTDGSLSGANRQATGFGGTVADSTARKQAEMNQELLTNVLRVLNRGGGSLQDLLRETLCLIKEAAGFDAVGLRLRQGDDYPYYEQNGFSDEFLRKENFLCARGGAGTILYDAAGRPKLECTCGLVLAGRTDPRHPFFTPGGSFWTNAAPELLALPREADPRLNPRNYCIHSGYQSFALIPVRAGEEIIGLLQLNDRRPGRFTPAQINFFESLAQNIGLALQRTMAEEALREANRHKDNFIAMLGHELRNPLAPIANAAEVLRRVQSTDPLLPRAREMIERQVEHMVRLVDDLLDISRVSHGKIVLRKEMLDLAPLLRATAQDCRPQLEAAGLSLETSLSDGPVWVDGDPARLRQIVGNLLDNAVKFTDRGGRISLELRAEAATKTARITVADTGWGIAPDKMGRIFEPFDQAGREGAGTRHGLGLGLALVKALAGLHGGTIQAISAGLGRGSQFIVTLPLQPAPAASSQPAATSVSAPVSAPAVVTCARRILVIEDNSFVADGIRMSLESEGHTVTVVRNGSAGVAKARECKPEMVLCDLGLPDGMDGHAVARALRQDPQTAQGFLVAYSGFGQEQDKRRSLEAGFDLHLTKPVRLQDLRAAMAQIPGGH